MESGPPTLVRPCLRRLYPLSNENADGAAGMMLAYMHGLVQPVYDSANGLMQPVYDSQWAGAAGVRWDDVVGYLNRLTPRQYKGIGK